VQQVLARIEQWRRTRPKRTRMPEALWAAATAVAREHGVHLTARALRVNYESLKHRVSVGPAPAVAGRFVELRGADLIGGGPPTSGAVVEVSDVDGARMTIRLGADTELDPAALVGAFRRPAA
jgi:hypothetical protein